MALKDLKLSRVLLFFPWKTVQGFQSTKLAPECWPVELKMPLRVHDTITLPYKYMAIQQVRTFIIQNFHFEEVEDDWLKGLRTLKIYLSWPSRECFPRIGIDMEGDIEPRGVRLLSQFEVDRMHQCAQAGSVYHCMEGAFLVKHREYPTDPAAPFLERVWLERVA